MKITSILRENSIDFIESGPNVSPGNVNINCPYCGAADPSYHMGIHAETGLWGCWRMPDHRGRDFAWLLAKLLGLDHDAAKALCGGQSLDTFEHVKDILLGEILTKSEPKAVEQKWPSGTRQLFPRTPAIERYHRYLQGRGFADSDAVAAEYGLMGGFAGGFVGRLLFPIRRADGILIGYTGRSLGKSAIRYLSFPSGPVVKQTVLFLDRITAPPPGTHTLFITEGPFDALNMDWKGKKHGCMATCLFGSIATKAQINLLVNLMVEHQKFRRILLMLDGDAWSQTLKLAASLSETNAEVILLQGSDPGGLQAQKVDDLMKERNNVLD